jgi:hypothetical protein
LRAVVASAAVDTAVVAAVGDGDAEVGDGAAVAVGQALRAGEWRRCCSGRDGLGRHVYVFDAREAAKYRDATTSTVSTVV